MKRALLIGLCSSVLLAGCAAPNANQSTRNERKAQAAEEKRAEYERSRAIDSRAAQYERQGMSNTEARAAAERSAPGLLPPR